MSPEELVEAKNGLASYLASLGALSARPEYAAAAQHNDFIRVLHASLGSIPQDTLLGTPAPWPQLFLQAIRHAHATVAQATASIVPRPATVRTPTSRPPNSAALSAAVAPAIAAAVATAQQLAVSGHVLLLKGGLAAYDASPQLAILQSEFRTQCDEQMKTIGELRASIVAEYNTIQEQRTQATLSIESTQRACDAALANTNAQASQMLSSVEAAQANCSAAIGESRSRADTLLTDARAATIKSIEELQRDVRTSKTESEQALNAVREQALRDLAASRTTTEQALQTQREEASVTLESLRRDAETTFSSLIEQANVTLRKAREAQAEGGIGTHARIFKQAAVAHQKVASHWLFAAAIMALSAVVWLTAAPFWLKSASAVPKDYVVYFVGNTMLLGMAIYCGRMARTERHNMVVNQHRQNALTTYQAIVDHAGSDDEVRSAIVLQATQTIFAPQPTGHWESKGSPAGDQIPLPLLALLSELTKAGRSKES